MRITRSTGFRDNRLWLKGGTVHILLLKFATNDMSHKRPSDGWVFLATSWALAV